MSEADGDPEPTGRRIVTPPRDGAVVPPAPLDRQGPPVVRRRRGGSAPASSLNSPLLSGRSLEPEVKPKRFAVLREHPAITVSVLVVLVALVVVLGGKFLAERAADSATSARAAEIRELLDGATPEEFLAFNAGVRRDGSLAQQIRDEPGFVNVTAVADESYIRFQPGGWWAGFTERCIVAVVHADGVDVTVPKTACIRVEGPPD
ncbi:MAG: hypothetical protein ACYC2O_06205 [Microthrixaceae bacterium]